MNMMPYKVWTEKLGKKLDVWFKTLTDCQGNTAQAAFKLGIEERFFQIVGETILLFTVLLFLLLCLNLCSFPSHFKGDLFCIYSVSSVPFGDRKLFFSYYSMGC